jgi:hypothetical protein
MRLARILSGIALFAVAARLGAQPAPLRVKYDIMCPACTIEMTKVASLGGPSDPVYLADVASLARDSRGRFFAVGGAGHQVVAFDAEGRYVTAFGEGQGPGELNGPWDISSALIGQGDSIFVFHSQSFVAVFSPQLKYVRTFHLPASLTLMGAVAALHDGTFLLGARISSYPFVGWPYHIVNPNGVVLRSFGIDSAASALNQAQRARSLWFALSPNDSSMWTMSRYQLERSSLDGGDRATFDVYDVPWLPPPTYSNTVSGRGVPTPTSGGTGGSVTLAGVDSSGLLWITGMDPANTIAALRMLQSGSATEGVSSVIDVFDPRSGTVLASQRSPVGIRLLPGGNLAYSASRNADGVISLTVWRIGLRRP